MLLVVGVMAVFSFNPSLMEDLIADVDLARFSVDLTRFNADLVRFGVDLARFSVDLARFSVDLARFSVTDQNKHYSSRKTKKRVKLNKDAET